MVAGRAGVYAPGVTVSDFLLARCQEALEAAACEYEIHSGGELRCLCSDPAEEVLATLNRMSFVLWLAELDTAGEAFLRVLADSLATHPDYQDDWHSLS